MVCQDAPDTSVLDTTVTCEEATNPSESIWGLLLEGNRRECDRPCWLGEEERLPDSNGEHAQQRLALDPANQHDQPCGAIK